jgi:biotin carboxylase
MNKSEQRLLVLGAGRYQLKLIRKAEKRGIRTVISDYLPDSPGREISSYPTMTDMMDVEANISLGRKYKVSGVITSGTDQALNVMARASEALGLPCYLSPEAAKRCTDKTAMSEVMQNAGLPCPRHLVVSARDPLSAASMHLNYPVVVKPSDAQGQRGTSKVRQASQFDAALLAALEASRNGYAIIQEFIEGPEITVSAWMHEGRTRLLMVTDRVTYNLPPALGVCFQHIFPSKHAQHLTAEVRQLVTDLGTAYGVTEGPFYVQMIVGRDQVYFVEGSCRIGGGHEDSLIPMATGVDVTDLLIDLAFTGIASPFDFDFDPQQVQNHFLVNFLLAKPGIISKQFLPSVDEASGLRENGFYYSESYQQGEIINALGRLGYFICQAPDRASLLERARHIYDSHHILDADGEEMVFWPDDQYMNGV